VPRVLAGCSQPPAPPPELCRQSSPAFAGRSLLRTPGNHHPMTRILHDREVYRRIVTRNNRLILQK
jgi:hypothetical protein